MNISPEEAAQALREIEASRAAMRAAIRSHRGHFYLWLWGFIWIAIAALGWIESTQFWITSALSLVGIVATFAIAFIHGSHVRTKIDRRFLAVCIALILFGYIAFPAVLGAPHSYKSGFALSILVVMQLYVVSGIWFDNYLLWVGIIITALTVATILFLPALFWASTALCGATLVASGFYVRSSWR